MEANAKLKFEQFYETHVLPFYDIPFKGIVWQGHDRIGNNVFAHYFSTDDQEYILVFEDFRSEAHFIAEDSELLLTRDRSPGVDLSAKSGEDYVENRTGHFTLYRGR